MAYARGRGPFHIRNVWNGASLHIESGGLAAGEIDPNWASAKWTVEPVVNAYAHLRNVWKTDHYLNVEGGPVRVSAIDPGWNSARWMLLPVRGNGVVQIRNMHLSDAYLNMENGVLAAGPIDRGWDSAKWELR